MENVGSEKPSEMFAIVELFGHQKIAGRISEQTFGGANFVRVDVPEVTVSNRYLSEDTRGRTIPAHTRSFGPSAIYSINWCDKETASIAAQQIRHLPISDFSIREAIDLLDSGSRQRFLESFESKV